MRKRPKRWSVRFELGPEEEDHVRLHDYLGGLAEEGDASEWIRQTLIAALPSQAAGDKGVLSSLRNYSTRSPSIGPTNPAIPASRLPLPRQPIQRPDHTMRPSPDQTDGGSDDDLTYEEIDS